MKLTKIFRKPIQLSTAFALAILGVSSFAPVQSRPIELENPIIISSRWPTPPDKGAPGDIVGGGPRRNGENCQIEAPLAALLPHNGFGETLEESPILWFYIPYLPKNVSSTKFVLHDKNGKSVDSPIQFNLPEKPGIVKLRLPSLAIDEQYKWELYLDINCDSSAESRSESIYVAGSVRRRLARPTIEENLKSAKTDLERVKLYIEAGIWQDALTLLAELRYEDETNQNLKNEWANLIESAEWKAEELELDSEEDLTKLKETIISAPIFP